MGRYKLLVFLLLCINPLNTENISARLPRFDNPDNNSKVRRIGFAVEKGFLPIHNYSHKAYNGQPQNWAIVQDKRGVMYFGNNEGVLEFDGMNWRLIETLNETNVRSLACDDKGNIYVGAVGEIGYLSADSTGKMMFFSLMKYIRQSDREFIDVWKTITTEEGVYFQSAEKIFHCDGDTMRSWDPETSFHILFYPQPGTEGTARKMFIRQPGVCLMKFERDSIVMVAV